MKIAELFRRDPKREIAEVIKVTTSDESVIVDEIDEYVVTENIREQLERVVETYRESIDIATESTNVWVSGFFGSGKSSFAKILGNLLANPILDGRPAAERILERVASAATMRALLNVIQQRTPTLAVYLDLSSGIDVLGGGTESVVLPLYRQLLERFGYSRNETLAELEFTLEGEDRLAEFEAAFEAVSDGRRWVDERGSALAKNRASAALNRIDPEAFPAADSWARAGVKPEITAAWFAKRALQLLERRGAGAKRIVFVVDEVGQYVARDRKKMLDLQGVAEQLQKHRGPLWLVATSQERLDDVMDALESKRTELARVQDRFPIRVDLLPSDIGEVAGKRVLDKNEAGQRAVRDLVQVNRHRLGATTRLDAPGRDSTLVEDDVVRLYPLLPYHVQLLIDAVSARRQGPTAGGSNRTIIKLAQQLLVDPRYGLLDHPVGALATLDRAANLLHAVIPPSLQAEVDQVADRHGTDSTEAAMLNVVALCFDTPRLPLTTANLAALTHPAIDADSRIAEVQAALDTLVSEDRLRKDEGVYGLQSPEQKDWEKERRGKELSPASASKIRKKLLEEALAGLAVTNRRSFKVAVLTDDTKIADGEVVLHVIDGERKDLETVRALSRTDEHRHAIHWVHTIGNDDTWPAFTELYRSQAMISDKDTPSRSEADAHLLMLERRREAEAEQEARRLFERDLAAGKIVFGGTVTDPVGGSIRQMAENAVAVNIPRIYDSLASFAAAVGSKDAIIVLRADPGGRAPKGLGDDGIGLYTATASGDALITTAGPLVDLVDLVTKKHGYGEQASGDWLARELARPPRGADLEVTRVLCAAAIRAGLLEVTSAGARITNPADQRLDKVFTTVPAFRQAAFSPPPPDVGLEVRAEVADKLGRRTGTKEPIATDDLANSLRALVLQTGPAASRIIAGFKGVDVPVPEAVTRTQNLVGDILTGSAATAVTTAAHAWEDLTAGLDLVSDLDDHLDEDLDLLRHARRCLDQPTPATATATINVLADLLAAGDIATHRADIAAATATIDNARSEVAAFEHQAAQQVLADMRTELRRRHETLEPAIVDEALRDIDGVVPDDPAAFRAGDLDGYRYRLDQAKTKAEHLLAETEAAGRLATVVVADIAPDLITSAEQLDGVLAAIRRSVEEHLADERQVRLT